MALNAFMTVKGQKQGDIKGSVTQKGRENMILVHGASHEIVSPRDAASGQATGKRMHKPFVVIKEVDKASPLLYGAMVSNENLVECVVRFWRPAMQGGAGIGTEQQYYTVKLTNASIASIGFRMADNRSPDLMKLTEYEDVSFVYQKIEWTWTDGGIVATDDWVAAF